MNRPWLDGMWDNIRQKYGIYLRLLEAIPESAFAETPVPGLRNATEMAVHTSGSIVRDIAQGVAKGEITADEHAEGDVAAGLKDKAAVIAFARECWRLADAAVAEIDDARLAAMVPTPWNMTFPGWMGFAILNDEFTHHRGQLYVYCRMGGVVPPFMWSFGENGEGFRP